MGSKSTERKEIGTTYYNGDLVAFISRGKVLGKEYYEIRLSNGKIRTVPASACSATKDASKSKGD